jgi:hypothetical protein
VIIHRGPKNFLKKWHFLSKKSKISSKMPFFSKNLLLKILGGGRVAFNENFIGVRGYFKPPTPHTPP